MVATTTITESNARFAGQHHEGLVCVFVGATAGIGFATLERMATMLYSSTFYVLGRRPSRYASKLQHLRELSPSNEFIFVETQVSLIASIDAACDQIKSAEQKVDYICMSSGGLPFQGAEYTDEGLELCFTLSYYSRLRLVSNLMSLINHSPHPRVLSILNGTKEKRMNEDDIGLEKKWAMMAVIKHSTVFTSLAFDHLAANDSQKKIVFIHGHPGLVSTGTPRTTYPSTKDGYVWWVFMSVMQILTGWLIQYFGKPVKESGERHAFYLTSDSLSPGSWRVNSSSDIVPANTVLKDYQNRGWADKIWDYTVRVWDNALIAGAKS